jgi:flagellar hook protein FlgE
MGIYGALTTAVSGLRAQSYALENISGNIANARTTGFKRVDTNFVDLVPNTMAGRETAGSVTTYAQATNTIQGDLNTTNIGTNIALNSEGFFVVQERTGFAGGNPTFAGIDLYTRRGDFEMDRNGYLVNGAGFYLKGIKLDPVSGDLVGSQPGLIKVDGDNLPAKQSTEIEYRANLPSYPKTDASDRAVAGSELLGAGFIGGANPPTIFGSEDTQFLQRSITGGSITIYNQQGAPIPVQLRWAKRTNAPDSWNAYYLSDTNATTAAQPRWQKLGPDFNFSAAGQLTTALPLAAQTITYNGVTVTPVNVRVTTTGLTQFEDADIAASGDVRVNALRQDGYPSGQLNNVSVGEGGRVFGNYTNGQVVGLAQISIAQFNADNQLQRRDGGVFEQTLDSGAPIITQGGRNVVGGAIENSNTDIADEFSKMIITQQAYSANTRVISTSSDMLRDILSIVR